jgi:HEAT repeat protein
MSFFDPLSCVIGLGVGGAAGAGGMYVLKEHLPQWAARRDRTAAATPSLSGPGRAGGLGNWLPQSLSPQSSGPYREELRDFLRYRHLPGRQVALSQILIEPRFIAGRGPTLHLDEDERGILVETDIFRVIPMLHQFPAIYASFQMETFSLQDFETGHRHIAILGLPGSGKSTALALLGLIALGEVSLEAYRDQDRLEFDEAEDEGLSEAMRERQERERQEVQERAIRELRELQKKTEEAQALARKDAAVDLDQLFPIYVHVHDLDLNPAHYGGQIDPSEPLVRAQGTYLSAKTAINSSPSLYAQLKDNDCLILVDGLDELLPEERPPYLEWLGALREFYGQHLIVAAGPAVAYDPLINLGFAPTFIIPPDQKHANELIERWVTAWQKIATLPPQADIDSLWADIRNRSVLDLTMKIWAVLQGDIHETGRRGYYEDYIRHALGGDEALTDLAQSLAAIWLEEGRKPDAARLQQLIADRLGLAEEAPLETSEDSQAKGKKASPNEAKSKVEALAQKLRATALIHTLADGTYGFCHPVIAWYLAGETLKDAGAERLAHLADKPYWSGALGFATAILDIEPAVLQKVKSQADLLYSNMFSVVEWMPDAPDNLRWKTEILKRFSAAVLAPNQFPAMREYAVAALVAARDNTGGVAYILRTAARSAIPDLRRLGCIGLGALGVEVAVNDISQVLYDEVPEVQLAAGMALGAIGSQTALEAMTEALLTGDQSLRKAVAEAFASIPGEGHLLLHDGIRHQDIEVRRACAYGLARIPQTWALIDLYRAMLEDDQWSVRQACKQAFSQAREFSQGGPQFYAEPQAYEWLATWAASKGQAVPEGENGRQLLMQALQTAPSRVRVESAKALGSLAYLPAAKALYSLLADGDEQVRVAAYESLGRMSNRLGRPMPGVF